MQELVAKILSYSFRLLGNLGVRAANWITINKSNISFGEGLRINGKIIIKNRGKIKLGNRVLINNHSSYNPVGLPHETVLATINEQASGS